MRHILAIRLTVYRSRTAIATLTASNASDWAFGQRIDLDGNVAAIAVDAAAYLFARHEQQWREISRIPVGDPEHIGLTSVAYDRGVLALGITEFTDEGSLPGRVDLYESDPKGGVRRIATLRAGDGLPGDGFGAHRRHAGIFVSGRERHWPGQHPGVRQRVILAHRATGTHRSRAWLRQRVAFASEEEYGTRR